jgi:hypothetical protein
MNLPLIDSVISTETEDGYFFILNEGEDTYYGGNYIEGVLMEMLITLYETEPNAKVDLVDFAKYVMKSTNS